MALSPAQHLNNGFQRLMDALPSGNKKVPTVQACSHPNVQTSIFNCIDAANVGLIASLLHHNTYEPLEDKACLLSGAVACSHFAARAALQSRSHLPQRSKAERIARVCLEGSGALATSATVVVYSGFEPNRPDVALASMLGASMVYLATRQALHIQRRCQRT